jgi:Protein of unknown function (DUF2807).
MNRTIKKISGLAVLLALITLNTSCSLAKRIKANGNYITKEINVANFDGIKLQGSEDILYSQSTDGKSSVKIYASDNVIDLYDIRVENGILIVSQKKNVTIFSFGDKDAVKVIVSNPTLNSLKVQGSGDIILKTAIKSGKLDVCVQGSGDIKGSGLYCSELYTTIQGSGDLKLENISSGNVDATVQGSGDIALSGAAKIVSLKTQGSGDINAANLKGQDVIATTQGSGDISCYATGNLKARISGSGDISYRGKPNIDFPQEKKLNRID